MACVYVGRVHACVRARAQSSTCACVRGPLLKHIQELITEIIQWLAAAAPTVPPLLEVRGRRQPRREREKMVARREVDRKQSRADMKVEGWIGVEEEEKKKQNKTGGSLAVSLSPLPEIYILLSPRSWLLHGSTAISQTRTHALNEVWPCR